MAETYSTLTALFTDIADAIREKTGDAATIVADDFPDMIRERLQAIPFYLAFSSPNSFTLAVNDGTKHWDGALEYSNDTYTWSTWDGTNTLSSDISERGNVLYLRGTGNTKFGYYDDRSQEYIPWVINGTNVRCNGNIETLLDYATVKDGQHPTMADECFAGLFTGCTALTQAPALPATTLTYYCYYDMFSGCTSLTQSPDLPATTLADYCYQEMFYNCTSLTQASALPATTLSNNCYASMFGGCTSLTQAPALPATTLAVGCYTGMFYGCTSLTKAPSLPATTLADYCYQEMFWGCTSLTQAPALPATTLATYCYQNMFRDCARIKLSSTKTGNYTVAYRIPTTGTGTTASNALSNMFTSTGGTFKGAPSINTTYYLSNTNTVV